jgi:hypothetical protein
MSFPWNRVHWAVVDSRDRATGTKGQFTFDLGTAISNVTAVTVTSVRPPHTVQNVASGDQRMLLVHSLYVPDPPPGPPLAAHTFVDVRVPIGYYDTPAALAAAVESSINDRLGGGTYTVTYETVPVTSGTAPTRFKIRCNVPATYFTILPDFETVADVVAAVYTDVECQSLSNFHGAAGLVMAGERSLRETMGMTAGAYYSNKLTESSGYDAASAYLTSNVDTTDASNVGVVICSAQPDLRIGDFGFLYLMEIDASYTDPGLHTLTRSQQRSLLQTSTPLCRLSVPSASEQRTEDLTYQITGENAVRSRDVGRHWFDLPRTVTFVWADKTHAFLDPVHCTESAWVLKIEYEERTQDATEK